MSSNKQPRGTNEFEDNPDVIHVRSAEEEEETLADGDEEAKRGFSDAVDPAATRLGVDRDGQEFGGVDQQDPDVHLRHYKSAASFTAHETFDEALASA